MDDREAQQFYLEYRVSAEQLKQVQEYLDQTAEGIVEITNLIGALDSLSTIEQGSRIFAPLANGVFLDASLNDSAHVRMNVGSGVVVKKTISEAKTLLEQQRKDLEVLRERATGDAMKLNLRMREIEQWMETAEKKREHQTTPSRPSRSEASPRPAASTDPATPLKTPLHTSIRGRHIHSHQSSGKSSGSAKAHRR